MATATTRTLGGRAAARSSKTDMSLPHVSHQHPHRWSRTTWPRNEESAVEVLLGRNATKSGAALPTGTEAGDGLEAPHPDRTTAAIAERRIVMFIAWFERVDCVLSGVKAGAGAHLTSLRVVTATVCSPVAAMLHTQAWVRTLPPKSCRSQWKPISARCRASSKAWSIVSARRCRRTGSSKRRA